MQCSYYLATNIEDRPTLFLLLSVLDPATQALYCILHERKPGKVDGDTRFLPVQQQCLCYLLVDSFVDVLFAWGQAGQEDG